MWIKSYAVVTKEATKEQLWKLVSHVNEWHKWDKGIDYAKMDGEFKVGNQFLLKPKGGPKINITLVEVEEYKKFTDCTRFPLAKMYGEHLFEETEDGLKLTVTMKVKGLLAWLWIKIVAQDIVDALPEDVKNQIQHASKL